MKIYLLKTKTGRYEIGMTTSQVNFDNLVKSITSTLVDYYETDNRLMEALLNIKWRRFQKENGFELPLFEVVRFKPICRILETV